MTEMFGNLTAMMTLLSKSMDLMDGGSRKKREMSFHGHAPAPEPSSPTAATSTTTAHPPTSWQQPHSNLTGLTSTPAVTHQLPLLAPEHVRQEAPFQEGTPPHLPDISEAVRT